MVHKGHILLINLHKPYWRKVIKLNKSFFQQGVTLGNAFVNPANDEFHLQKAWQQLSQTYSVPLHLCISAAQRRGIVEPLSSNNQQQNNLAEGFILAGLGEFNKAVLQADRLITI